MAKRALSTSQAIQLVDRPMFTSREITTLSGVSLAATSRALERMESRGQIRRVRRGLWCIPRDPRFSPFALVHFLAGSHQAYVSLLSALHLHGQIEQIPQVVYAATTGHGRLVRTPVGAYSFHRIHPEFFTGFDWYGGKRDFLVATPEKALVDALYLSSRKGKRFRFFPEMDLGKSFSMRKAVLWARRIRSARIQNYVLTNLRRLSKTKDQRPRPR